MEHLITLAAQTWGQTWTVLWVVPVAAGMVAAGFLMDRVDQVDHRTG
jgi:hypothetical protein